MPHFRISELYYGKRYNPSKTSQKAGKDFSTQPSFRIQTPGTFNPAMAKLMAMR
jgi:hypothetical protein